MEFLFDHLPIVVLIIGICILMRFPYIGGGLMLAAVCAEVGQYWLAAACILICLGMHWIMGKHIRPRKGSVGPSRASRRQQKREEQRRQKQGDE